MKRAHILLSLIIYVIGSQAATAQESVISKLKAEGALVLYHDYRSFSYHDWSGNGNDGVPTDVVMTNNGVRFPSSTSKITVADSPELQLTEGTLVVYGEFLEQGAGDRLISKRDGGGTNYELFIFSTGSGVSFYDGTTSSTVITNITGKKYIAANIKNGQDYELFVDGVSVGSTGTLSISVDDAPLEIGSFYVSGYNFSGSTLSAALIVNRELTAGEHAQLYAELSRMRWPSRGWFVDKDSDTTDGDVQFATTWAAYEASNLTAGMQVPNTPLWVSSGTWSVVVEDIDGKPTKVLRCDSSGIVYVSASYLNGGPTEDAYGTWEWWMYKSDASYPQTHFIADAISSSAGYMIYMNNVETLYLWETGVGSKFSTASSYVSSSTWHRYRVTRRDTDGQFTVYLDGSLVDTSGGGGSNPVVDNTTQESKFLVFDLDAGDRVALGSVDGSHRIVKYRGVVAP